MKYLVAAATLALLSLPQPTFAKTYKCKAKAAGAQYSLTFSKGRLRAGGFSMEVRADPDGTIWIFPQGERFAMRPDGVILDRGGSKSGSHKCNVNAIKAALKG